METPIFQFFLIVSAIFIFSACNSDKATVRPDVINNTTDTSERLDTIILSQVEKFAYNISLNIDKHESTLWYKYRDNKVSDIVYYLYNPDNSIASTTTTSFNYDGNVLLSFREVTTVARGTIADATTSFTYNSQGYLIRSEQINGGITGTLSQIHDYVYNENGQVIRITQIKPGQASSPILSTYNYDVNGRVSEAIIAGTAFNFTWVRNNLTKVTKNGVLLKEFTYNSDANYFLPLPETFLGMPNPLGYHPGSNDDTPSYFSPLPKAFFSTPCPLGYCADNNVKQTRVYIDGRVDEDGRYSYTLGSNGLFKEVEITDNSQDHRLIARYEHHFREVKW